MAACTHSAAPPPQPSLCRPTPKAPPLRSFPPTQHAADTKVLTGVEANLQSVRKDVRHTISDVKNIVSQLELALQQLRAQAAAVAAAKVPQARPGMGNATKEAGGPPARPLPPSASSSGAAGGPGASPPPPSALPAPLANSARQRASELAQELSKALGVKSLAGAAMNATSALRSLETVRASALSSLVALNQTLGILDQVGGAGGRVEEAEGLGALPLYQNPEALNPLNIRSR